MKLLTAIFGLLLLNVSLYLNKYPIFPQFNSVDFKNHVEMARYVASGNLPDPVFLYGGVEFYLASLIALFSPIQPLLIVRYAMAAFLLLSPIIFYVFGKTISHLAAFSSLLALSYVVTGYVWFGYVFNAGIYANFYGIISSLLLIIVTIRYFETKKVGTPTLFLGIAILNGLLSHYTTLFAFMPLIAVAAWKSIYDKHCRRKAQLCLVMLVSPLAAGFIAFPSIPRILSGFITSQPSTYVPVPDTWLSSIIPLPVLKYLVALIDPPEPFRNDAAAVSAFILAGIFLYALLKEPDYRRAIVAIWFFLSLAAPTNESAWRFAAVSLVPLLVMDSYGLLFAVRKLAPGLRWEKFFPRFGRTSRRKVSGLFIIIVLLIPSMFASSWGAASFLNSISSPESVASSDLAVLHAIQYLKSIPEDCGSDNRTVCHFVAVSDWRLTYSAILGGPNVQLIQPSPYPTPETIQTLMKQSGVKYFLSTPVGRINLPYCAQPGGDVITLNVKNSTKGNSLKADISMYPKLNRTNGPVSFFMDGEPYGQLYLENGRAEVTILDIPKGQHDIRIRHKFAGSNVITIFMGEDKAPIALELNLNYCDPWSYQVDDWGSGAKLIWRNNFVKLWQLQ